MRPGPGPQPDQGAQVEQSQMATSGFVGDEAGGSEMKLEGGFQLTVGDLFLKMVSSTPPIHYSIDYSIHLSIYPSIHPFIPPSLPPR